MKKILFKTFACFLLLSSCTKSEKLSDENEISFTSSISNEARTSQSSLEKDRKVQLFISERVIENEIQPPKLDDFYQMVSNGERKLNYSNSTIPVYPENPIDIYAYTGLSTEGQPENIEFLELNLNTNQEDLTEFPIYDFLYAKSTKGHVYDGEPIKLTFKHAFSKIVLNFIESSEDADIGQLSSVTMHDLSNEANFDIKECVLIDKSGRENFIPKLPSNLEPKSSLIIIPQEVEKGQILFSFTYFGKLFEYKCPRDISFEPGKQYNYTINLLEENGVFDEFIDIDYDIEDWTSEDMDNVTVGYHKIRTIQFIDFKDGINLKRADIYLPDGMLSYNINKNSINFTLPSEYSNFNLEKIHFYTEDNQEFDYYFYSTEIINETTILSIPPPEIGTLYGDGVVFIAGKVTGYNDEEKCYIVDNEGINAYKGRMLYIKDLGNLAWQSNMDLFFMEMTDRNHGSNNMSIFNSYIKSNSKEIEDYPAIEKCLNLGENWYLPAINELHFIFQNLEKINKVLQDNKGDILVKDKYRPYFSSTEDDKTRVLAIEPEEMETINYADKFNIRPTRAVKEF